MAVPSALAHVPSLTGRPSAEEERSGSASFRTVVLGVLVVLLLAASGTLVWLLAGRRGEAAELQQQREAVMSQTDQFMLRMGTYGPDVLDDKGGMPEYRSRVKAVITPKFAVSFEKEAGTAEQLVAQSGVSRQAEVFATGVSTLDGDSATALVAGAFTDTYPKGGQQVSIPFRIRVTLVNTDGKWLVDDFTPVTGASQ